MIINCFAQGPGPKTFSFFSNVKEIYFLSTLFDQYTTRKQSSDTCIDNHQVCKMTLTLFSFPPLSVGEEDVSATE